MSRTGPQDPDSPHFLDNPVSSQPGASAALIWDERLRGLIADVIKRSEVSRAQLADRMSLLSGESITVHQINAWTAPSKDGHRFPLALTPALCAALNDLEILRQLAALVGGRLATEDDLRFAEIGRLHLQAERVQARERALRTLLEDR